MPFMPNISAYVCVLQVFVAHFIAFYENCRHIHRAQVHIFAHFRHIKVISGVEKRENLCLAAVSLIWTKF